MGDDEGPGSDGPATALGAGGVESLPSAFEGDSDSAGGEAGFLPSDRTSFCPSSRFKPSSAAADVEAPGVERPSASASA